MKHCQMDPGEHLKALKWLGNNKKYQGINKLLFSILKFTHIHLYLQPASLIRPAPVELPQDRKVARVNG